jgi:IMP dehydrogenase
LGKGVEFPIPIVSANMKTVTGPEMCAEIYFHGGLAIMHRFYDSPKQQIEAYIKSIHLIGARSRYQVPSRGAIGVSVGTLSNGASEVIDEFAKLKAEIPPRIMCVDVAHGDSDVCIDTVKYIHNKYPEILLIAGNVATASGAQDLADAGADVIKVGIGNGSLCTTRLEAGNGVPQLTALEEVYDQSNNGKNFKVIADGGIRLAGDCVKALCFSHAVMLGNVLAGTDESPGEIIQTTDGKEYKTYAGSSTHKINHIEGVTGLVPCKGPVLKVIEKLLQGIKSGCSYQGAKNLEELKRNPEFVLISNAGLIESKPHDVIVIK